MENRRKFIRFPIKFSARYSKENENRWNQCSVIDISREGMGVIVYLNEKIHLSSILNLIIDVPGKKAPVSVAGTLAWIKEFEGNPEFNYEGGIKLITIDSEDKWLLLDYSYETWREDRAAK
ncbi:MAG: PilZ domain-containing protein [Deltaproteobacteria bacterium]|nr:PilZ domain-containing protein [Deltaproteobacteria bacterium]MBW2620014.1 PilZ domain-containing protein [Deltaproteobacteria bacterium]MBW2641985.1 PilZ domain-containing protein [Deltaproteobacteria bacterium]